MRVKVGQMMEGSHNTVKCVFQVLEPQTDYQTVKTGRLSIFICSMGKCVDIVVVLPHPRQIIVIFGLTPLN